ncbi:MAG: TOPRIM nucleotidyl transferase/hydrolase domain-containing protein [Candidatus Odinarchaeota archaeon]
MNSNQETQIKKINLEELKNKKAARSVPDITIEKVRARLSRQLTLPVCEGLFARAVVLCEGETEKMSLKIWAENENYDFPKKGIAFVQSDGKFSMIDLAEFYESFHIPVYLIWDSDSNTTENIENHKKHNKLLLSFSGAIPEEFPSTKFGDNYSVFDPDFESVLSDQMYISFETEVNNELGLINPNSQKGIRARYVALKYRENNLDTPPPIKNLLDKIDSIDLTIP